MCLELPPAVEPVFQTSPYSILLILPNNNHSFSSYDVVVRVPAENNRIIENVSYLLVAMLI